jgi:DNA-binding transcriptional LysR family regulator
MPHSSIRRYLRHGTFPQLSVFEAVARHGSYTRAAEELYMAQPTVSVQIRKLTETIGLPLLEQVGKTVRLTPVGKELLASCGELFQTLARFEQKVANLRGLQTGSLEIAVCGTAKCFASRILAGFARNHPDITVRMHVGPRQSLLERITANMDDLYLMADPPANPETVGLRMAPNPIVVLAHPDHRLAGRTGVPFAELAKEPLLVREPGSGTRSTTDRVFAGHGATPIVRMELGSSEAILEALAAGVGASILPRQVVGPDLAARLTEIDVEGFPLESHWYLVHPVGKQLSFIAQAFLDLVRAEAAQPESPGMSPSLVRFA